MHDDREAQNRLLEKHDTFSFLSFRANDDDNTTIKKIKIMVLVLLFTFSYSLLHYKTMQYITQTILTNLVKKKRKEKQPVKYHRLPFIHRWSYRFWGPRLPFSIIHHHQFVDTRSIVS
jgi:hypothetical protein